MSYERELAVALEAAREAGEILRRHYEQGTETWEKSEDNPVTLADLESDKAIANCLQEAFPADAVLSEETIRDDARRRPGRESQRVQAHGGTVGQHQNQIVEARGGRVVEAALQHRSPTEG